MSWLEIPCLCVVSCVSCFDFPRPSCVSCPLSSRVLFPWCIIYLCLSVFFSVLPLYHTWPPPCSLSSPVPCLVSSVCVFSLWLCPKSLTTPYIVHYIVTMLLYSAVWMSASVFPALHVRSLPLSAFAHVPASVCLPAWCSPCTSSPVWYVLDFCLLVWTLPFVELCFGFSCYLVFALVIFGFLIHLVFVFLSFDLIKLALCFPTSPHLLSPKPLSFSPLIPPWQLIKLKQFGLCATEYEQSHSVIILQTLKTDWEQSF